MEVQAVTVPLVLLRAAVRVLGVPAPALAVRALEVQVLYTLALEVLHVAVQRAPVQDLLAVVQVLGVLVHVLAAPALETPALGALTPAITLGTPARVDIQGPTLAAPVPRGTRVTPVHKATPATQIHRGTQGLTLVAPAHAAILILTQATQDLRVTLILIQVIPTRRVIQTRAQAVLITTTATATITITTITMTTTTTTTITTAMTTVRD